MKRSIRLGNSGKIRSTVLTLVALGILFMSLGSGLFTMLLTRSISGDAKIINEMGMIRGGIQRIVKLELSGEGNDHLIERMDQDIHKLLLTESLTDQAGTSFQETAYKLVGVWDQFKERLYEFEDVSDVVKWEQLIDMSEEIWIISNQLVEDSQLLSESKIRIYRYSYILIFTTLAMGLLILWLIRKYVRESLEHMVNHDGLTGLYNRRFFDESLNREVEKANRYGKPFSLLFFDVDHFKRVNDRYGHSVGDSVLKELSNRVRENIRGSDLLARIGGEEFAIIASETGLEEACQMAEKIRVLVARDPFQDAGGCTISLGITTFRKDDTGESMLKRADQSLYVAKEAGRDRFVAS